MNVFFFPLDNSIFLNVLEKKFFICKLIYFYIRVFFFSLRERNSEKKRERKQKIGKNVLKFNQQPHSLNSFLGALMLIVRGKWVGTAKEVGIPVRIHIYIYTRKCVFTPPYTLPDVCAQLKPLGNYIVVVFRKGRTDWNKFYVANKSDKHHC